MWMIVWWLSFFVMIVMVSLKVKSYMKIVAIYILIVFMYFSLFLLTFKLQQWLYLESIERVCTIYALRQWHLRKLPIDSRIFYLCVNVLIVFFCETLSIKYRLKEKCNLSYIKPVCLKSIRRKHLLSTFRQALHARYRKCSTVHLLTGKRYTRYTRYTILKTFSYILRYV